MCVIYLRRKEEAVSSAFSASSLTLHPDVHSTPHELQVAEKRSSHSLLLHARPCVLWCCYRCGHHLECNPSAMIGETWSSPSMIREYHLQEQSTYLFALIWLKRQGESCYRDDRYRDTAALQPMNRRDSVYSYSPSNAIHPVMQPLVIVVHNNWGGHPTLILALRPGEKE